MGAGAQFSRFLLPILEVLTELGDLDQYQK